YLLHSFPDRFTHEFFIKGAYPERPVVEEVYEVLRQECDAAGAFEIGPETVAGRMKAKTSPREVESATRILAHAGAITSENATGNSAYVRLLATPERVKREIADQDEMAIGFLRAMWRAVGSRLNDGAVIDLDGLAPAFSGYGAATPI